MRARRRRRLRFNATIHCRRRACPQNTWNCRNNRKPPTPPLTRLRQFELVNTPCNHGASDFKAPSRQRGRKVNAPARQRTNARFSGLTTFIFFARELRRLRPSLKVALAAGHRANASNSCKPLIFLLVPCICSATKDRMSSLPCPGPHAPGPRYDARAERESLSARVTNTAPPPRSSPCWLMVYVHSSGNQLRPPTWKKQ